MKKIDAHQHFWRYNPVRDTWIDNEMSILKKNFLPEDLEPILKSNNVDGCIVVQSDQSEDENMFQLENAGQFDFIKGVVGWVDIRSKNLEERLVYYKQFQKLKGFRHVLQGEKQRDLIINPDFLSGLKELGRYGFTYDILIFPDQLKYVEKMLMVCPDQKFVIDHMAKPPIKSNAISDWKKDIESVSRFENVYCKISGMVTENNWHTWQMADFTPYMDVVLSSFGIQRVMYGSDWPVCELAAPYADVLKITENYFSQLSLSEQELFFGKNTAAFYMIS